MAKRPTVSIICELSAVDNTYRETIMLLAHRVRKILCVKVFERVGVCLSDRNTGKIVSYV